MDVLGPEIFGRQLLASDHPASSVQEGRMEICIIVTTEFSDDDNTYFMERRYRDTEMFLKTLEW